MAKKQREDAAKSDICFNEPYLDIDEGSLRNDLENVVKFAILKQVTKQALGEINKNSLDK